MVVGAGKNGRPGFSSPHILGEDTWRRKVLHIYITLRFLPAHSGVCVCAWPSKGNKYDSWAG